MKTSSHTPLYVAFLTAVVLVLGGCGNATEPQGAAQDGPITDERYLTSERWNDGNAEVAFYRVSRTRNQYGEAEDQEFLVGTYLVKHDYDTEAEAKAGPDADQRVSAFKYALFYEFESGSYEYKRSYVVNARQSDLRPLKSSFTSFDWCSNLYKEQTFDLGDGVDYLMRSDDYGNRRASYDYIDRSYPPALIPLLIRGMDFQRDARLHFNVLLESGDVIPATAEREASEMVEAEGGSSQAERIVVRYEGEVPSPYAEAADSSETYWRGTGNDRLLLAVESATGRYRMDLVEAVRSPYWERNVYDELERVRTRP